MTLIYARDLFREVRKESGRAKERKKKRERERENWPISALLLHLARSSGSAGAPQASRRVGRTISHSAHSKAAAARGRKGGGNE